MQQAVTARILLGWRHCVQPPATCAPLERIQWL